MNLRGRIAIVTGAAVRVGEAIARGLAAEGVHVCVHFGRSREAAEIVAADLTAAGVHAVSVGADLSNAVTAARTIFTTCAEKLGPPDILVNSAAIFEPGTLRETTVDAWDRHLDINLKAPVFLCREFVRRRTTGARGDIINLVDWRGLQPPPGHLAYTVSKAGLVAVTQILARELAPELRVNGVALGAILAPEGREDDHRRRAELTVPLRKTGTPRDVVDAVRYLLQSDFVTGEILNVTGGEELN